MVNTTTRAILDSWVGKGVGDFCDNDFSSSQHNHCAHFVSHVLGMTHGLTCGGMTARAKRVSPGAGIRVHELFNKLHQRGPWSEAPSTTDGLLVFVTSAGNVHRNVMANVPRKHVGIVCGGAVYNFGNTEHVVRADASLDAFQMRFSHAYHDAKIPLFYGVPE